MSAETLEASLRDLGIPCRVEGIDRLALLIPDGGADGVEDPRIRREAVGLLRAHGFTHLALEITDEVTPA